MKNPCTLQLNNYYYMIYYSGIYYYSADIGYDRRVIRYIDDN